MPTKKQQDSTPTPERAEQHVEQAEDQLAAAEVAVVEAHQERAAAEQAASESGQAAVIQEQIERLQAAAEPAAGRVGYTVGVWAGRPHYRANDGSFDTFDEDEMRDRIRRGNFVPATDLRRETV